MILAAVVAGLALGLPAYTDPPAPRPVAVRTVEVQVVAYDRAAEATHLAAAAALGAAVAYKGAILDLAAADVSLGTILMMLAAVAGAAAGLPDRAGRQERQVGADHGHRAGRGLCDANRRHGNPLNLIRIVPAEG